MHKFFFRVWIHVWICEEIFHEFRTLIYVRNSYEFFARKVGYVTNGLYCTWTYSGGKILITVALADSKIQTQKQTESYLDHQSFSTT